MSLSLRKYKNIIFCNKSVRSPKSRASARIISQRGFWGSVILRYPTGLCRILHDVMGHFLFLEHPNQVMYYWTSLMNIKPTKSTDYHPDDQPSEPPQIQKIPCRIFSVMIAIYCRDFAISVDVHCKPLISGYECVDVLFCMAHVLITKTLFAIL